MTDKRISEIKTAVAILITIAILSIRTVSNHDEQNDGFRKLQLRVIAYQFLTGKLGDELKLVEPTDDKWAECRSRETMSGHEGGQDVAVIGFSTNSECLRGREVLGWGTLPDGSTFHFKRAAPGLNTKRVLDSWLAGTSQNADIYGEPDSHEVVEVWNDANPAERQSLLFVVRKPHGDSYAPINNEETGFPVTVSLLGDGGETLNLSGVRSRILTIASNLDVVAADPESAYRQVRNAIYNEQIKVPVLDVEVPYLPAMLFLLAVATAYLTAFSSNFRQLVFASEAPTEPWVPTEQPKHYSGRFDRVASRFERMMSWAVVSMAIVAPISIGVLASRAAIASKSDIRISAMIFGLTAVVAILTFATISNTRRFASRARRKES